MYELRNAEPKPESVAKTIFVGEKQIGEVRESTGTGSRFHAVIKVRQGEFALLFQGFGQTPELSIADAIKTGRDERDAFTEQLAWLSCELSELLMPREAVSNA